MNKVAISKKEKFRRVAKKLVLHIILLAGSVTMIAPFIWMISTSLKEKGAVFTYPPEFIPRSQEEITWNGREYEIYKVKIKGKMEKVIKIKEFRKDIAYVKVINFKPAIREEIEKSIKQLLPQQRKDLLPLNKYGLPVIEPKEIELESKFIKPLVRTITIKGKKYVLYRVKEGEKVKEVIMYKIKKEEYADYGIVQEIRNGVPVGEKMEVDVDELKPVKFKIPVGNKLKDVYIGIINGKEKYVIISKPRVVIGEQPFVRIGVVRIVKNGKVLDKEYNVIADDLMPSKVVKVETVKVGGIPIPKNYYEAVTKLGFTKLSIYAFELIRGWVISFKARIPTFIQFFVNSTFISLFITAGQVITSALAAYAFARLNFKFRDQLFFAYLATLMIPGQVTMIPTFILFKKLTQFNILQLVDAHPGVILPAMFTAYGTFLLRQFFLGIPKDLEESALIDGASRLKIWWEIILPLSKPALATLTTFVFMGAWNDFMWPLIILHTMEKKTLPVGIAAFQGRYTTEWTLLMAAAVIVLIPVIIVYIFNQRYFTRGIVLSGLK